MSILNYFSKDGSLKSNSFFYKNLALFFARNPTVLAEIQNQMSIPCHNCNELNNLVDFVFSNYKNNNNVMYFDHKRPSEKDIICCFSRCKDSLLMWAHYADNHKGGVIEFELPCDYADGWHEVNYSDKIPNIDDNAILFGDYSNVLDFLNLNYYTKANWWQYEQEVRFLFITSGGKLNQLLPENKLEQIKKDNFALVPFSPNVVKGIYLGVNSNIEKDEDFLSNQIAQFSTVPIYKARLKKDCYGLDFEQISI